MSVTTIPPAGLTATGVVAGTQGGVTSVPVITVNAQGQITTLTTVPIVPPVPLAGGAMTGGLSAPTIKSGDGTMYARTTGHQIANGTDIGWSRRSTLYFDDRASNCNGYMPNGNCAGNAQYTPPNGAWWTWGVAGVPTGNCGNPWGYDFVGGQTNTLFQPYVSFNYDGYYLLYDEIGGADYHRNYRNCNCGQCVGNCFDNCNCACACACDCACNCGNG